MIEARRGVAGRLGVTLLNLIAPGLGLLRIGDWRGALLAYGIGVVAFLPLLVGFASTPNISFGAYGALVSIVLAGAVIAYVSAISRTWRQSQFLSDLRPIWSRWYAIIGAVILAYCISWMLTGVAKSFYRNFYIPSEAMEPTLDKNDRIVASMGRPRELHRGDILLVKAPGAATYVKRLAALPGDKIALRGGKVFINGIAAPTVPSGTRKVSYPYVEATQAQVNLERFPGERGTHLIQDLGESAEDNFTEVTVAPGHVFVLGDNRDDSADSRIPADLGGLEQIPIGNIVGQPLFFYWPKAKIGQAVRNSGQ